jgi:eukaryotic-like serine/threonine-protein kinase
VRRKTGIRDFVPQTLIDNRYALGDLLGSGGMSEVYLAHDVVLDRDVALKVLRAQYSGNEEFIKRFRREARSAARLTHPNIVRVFDWGRSGDGTPYMVMEYLRCGALKDRILDGPLVPSTAAEIGSQVARALGYAHERGVIHRDIKPHNILLTDTGHAKVADFGIAWAATATTTTSWSSPFSGTVAYVSPEQAMGKPGDPRSDLYSLGVVLYEMLTGARPYRGENPWGIALQRANEPPRSPREANPNVPEPLDALTTKLLAKNPADRYASADELADDLERLRTALSSTAEGTEKVAGLSPSAREEQTEVTVLQPPAAAPMKVLKSYGSRRSKLLLALTALLFGVILLGFFARLLM